MDFELRPMLGISRHLPAVRGAGRVAASLRGLYLRKPRPSVLADVHGFGFRLDPAEFVDGWLLFGPQFYEPGELRFLRRNLKPGDVFVDVGAHIGLYSLIASRIVEPTGRVVAVEANPMTYAELSESIERNGARNITAMNVGVADREETLRLAIMTATSRASASFLWPGGEGIPIRCRPLYDVLRDLGVTSMSGLKIDIEGFEFRVLSRFFRDAPPASRPRFIVTEYLPEWAEAAGGNVIALLRGIGYRVVDTYFVAGRPVGHGLRLD